LHHNLFSQENSYSKVLSRDDNNNKVRCRATNPHYDAINAIIMDPNDGYSDIIVFNVTCKSALAI